MPFLHLPVQSGSDRVLTAMNRRHSAADYRRTVDNLRDARPDLALSSDFIVGYPGETGADFRATLDLVRNSPRITIPQIAESMKIEPNYLYRVMPKLVSDGQVRREGQGWHPAG